jgi:hypothetical protein
LFCVPERGDVERWTALGVSRSRIHVTGSIEFDPDVQTQSHTVAASPKLDGGGSNAFSPGSLVLFGLMSFLALREYVTLLPTRRADHRTLFWAFFIFTPLQYFLIAIQWYGMFAILIPVFAFLFVPARLAVAGDTESFLQRASMIQWGLMICVYCLSYKYIDFPMTDKFNPGVVGNISALIYITSDNVVLDLNGTTLDGTPPDPATAGITYGVFAYNNKTNIIRNVTVRNGTIKGFGVGVSLYGAGAVSSRIDMFWYISGQKLLFAADGKCAVGSDATPGNYLSRESGAHAAHPPIRSARRRPAFRDIEVAGRANAQPGFVCPTRKSRPRRRAFRRL